MSTWIDPAMWYQQLPSFYAAAAALITDQAGQVLLVKPTYRNHWSFPGGYIEQDEFPHVACRREVREELGLGVSVGPLLVVDWAPPAHPRPRPIMSLTFDCGVVPAGTQVRLARDELEDWAFLPADEAVHRLPGGVAARVHAALAAREHHNTTYLAAGEEVLPLDTNT